MVFLLLLLLLLLFSKALATYFKPWDSKLANCHWSHFTKQQYLIVFFQRLDSIVFVSKWLITSWLKYHATMLSDSPGSDYPLSEFIADNYLFFHELINYHHLVKDVSLIISSLPFSILQFTKLLGSEKLRYNAQLGSDQIWSL